MVNLRGFDFLLHVKFHCSRLVGASPDLDMAHLGSLFDQWFFHKQRKGREKSSKLDE